MSAPLVFNAANEIAVDAFLRNRIGFLDISRIIENTLNISKYINPDNRNPRSLDKEARINAEAQISEFTLKINFKMVFLSDFAFILVALFALGFTIFIHELGHFLAARQRGLIYQPDFLSDLVQSCLDGSRMVLNIEFQCFLLADMSPLPQLADMGRLEGDNENSDNPRLAALE